ncbi:MAG: hypothetical protein R2824_22250 [Saprospiraceae bacterium]|nr:hypothetical protein [Lewinella sp.]
MFSILDIFLVLAFLCTIIATAVSQQPTGPEGPVGGWLLLVFPFLFLTILGLLLLSKGSLNFIPGGRPVQILVLAGVLVTFSVSVLGGFSRYDSLIQKLIISVPYLILAGFAGVIHQSDLPNSRVVHLVAAIVLGATALAGWGVAGRGIFLYLKKDMERAAQRTQEEQAQEEEHEQGEIAEYAKLDDSAPLGALLRFTWSRNAAIRQQALERVSRFPGLDDQLIELLDQSSEDAVSYIANVYENPPARLAPAWGKMLERELKKWDSLQYNEHAGTWEQNLKPYFKGAQKIQLAGGSLHNELQLWHQHLQKCKGLGSLANFVKGLL